MRRLAFIVIFLVGATAVFEWSSRSFLTSWEPELRAAIESAASRSTHTRVQIDSIIPSFFHRIRLIHVEARDLNNPKQLVFQASEIELTISLIDLPRALAHRKAYEAIGLVSVKDPVLRLSRDQLAQRPSRRRAGSLPPWFTLAWEGGTIQWLDPDAPHGAWTLYQAQGAFRIRGPQMSFAMRGQVEEANSIRVHFSRFGERWNAQASISDGDTAGALTLARKLTHQSILPEAWSVRGHFDFDAEAGGRRMPNREDDWLRYVEKARLTFKRESAPAAGPALSLNGTLTYSQATISSPRMALECPWFAGEGRVDLLVGGIPGHREFIVRGSLPKGRIGQVAIEEAQLNADFKDGQWALQDTTCKLFNGRLSAKGTMSAADNNVAITAENLSLPHVHMNASANFTGPLTSGQIAGAWWLTDLELGAGSPPIREARGRLEIDKDHFEAEAGSEDPPFKIATEGSLSEESVDVDRLDLSLPSGARVSGDGSYSKSSRQVKATLEASRLVIPSDLPAWPSSLSAVKAIVEGKAKLSGTAEEPMLKGTLSTLELSNPAIPEGQVSLNFILDKRHLEIPEFTAEPGIQGRLMLDHQAQKPRWSLDAQFKEAPAAWLNVTSSTPWVSSGKVNGKLHLERKEDLVGQGDLQTQNVAVGKWVFLKADTRWTLFPDRLTLSDLDAELRLNRIHGQTTLSWNKTQGLDGPIRVDGRGDLFSAATSSAPWTVPFHLNGALARKDHAFDGSLDLDAHAFDAPLKGRLQFSSDPAHPQTTFSAHIDGAHWRSFVLSSALDGAWSRDGLKPLTLKGHLASGGDFEFNGRLSPNQDAEGTLKLTNLNLAPVGQTLRFPKSLQGIASTTLTLTGPLSRLVWTGHLEAAHVVYAPEAEHPMKISDIDTNMTLAPSPKDPSVEQLVMRDGEAKTEEELVRFAPDSFIEFAGQNPARLQVGAQIRNLHLGLFTLFGGLDVDGTWQIKEDGFAIRAKTYTHSMFINDYELEEGVTIADYYNGVLRFSAPPNTPSLVTGTIDFHKAPDLQFTDFFISGKDQEKLQISGNIGPSLWDFHMMGKRLDMGTLGELSSFPYPLSGAADVEVRGTGDPKHPHVEGSVVFDHGTVMGLSFRSGSAGFSWQDARITFTQLYLSDPGRYKLQGAGYFPLLRKDNETLFADHTIDFSVHLLDANLGLLQSFSPEIKQAKGGVEGLLQIKGTIENPSLHGSVKVSNGDIVGAHYFRHLQNGKLSLDFEGDTINIRELHGKSGNGEFQGSGTITLAGFVPAKYDITFDVVSPKGVDVEVPELAIPDSPLAKRFRFLTSASRCDVRGHVTLKGPAESPVFSGTALFSNGHFTFPPSRKGSPNLAVLDWFRRITWDVDLKFLEGAWFENELIQANVTGNLALKGPSDQLRVDGALDISEGKISYLGLQFDIQQARYVVKSEASGNTVTNTPYLGGVAESQIQGVDTVSGASGTGGRLSVNDTITLNIDYAPISEIKPRLTSASNPTLSQDKILARVTQTDVENLTPQERNYLYQKQLVSLIDSSLTTPLAQNVLKKAGIADRLRVQHVFDPTTVTGQDLNSATGPQQQSTAVSLFANTKYTIEKDLSNRLSLGYGVRFIPSSVVDPEIQQQKLDLVSDVQLSYRWFRNVYLRGDFDLPTANPNILPERKVTIEPRWRFGWWGNTNKDKENPKSAQ